MWFKKTSGTHFHNFMMFFTCKHSNKKVQLGSTCCCRIITMCSYLTFNSLRKKSQKVVMNSNNSFSLRARNKFKCLKAKIYVEKSKKSKKKGWEAREKEKMKKFSHKKILGRWIWGTAHSTNSRTHTSLIFDYFISPTKLKIAFYRCRCS